MFSAMVSLVKVQALNYTSCDVYGFLLAEIKSLPIPASGMQMATTSARIIVAGKLRLGRG
jgi:hypothetical protein